MARELVKRMLELVMKTGPFFSQLRESQGQQYRQLLHTPKPSNEKGMHTVVELLESDETDGEIDEKGTTIALLVDTELCEETTVTKDAIGAPEGVVSAGVVVTTEELGGGTTTDDAGVVEGRGEVLTDDVED